MTETGKIRPENAAERLENLAVSYMEGTLDEAGEAELKAMLLSSPGGEVPRGYEAIALLFRGFGAMAQERMPERTGRKRLFIAAVSAAAAAAAVAGLFFIVRPVYGYDSFGKPITDREKALSRTECFQQLSRLDISVKSAGELACFLDPCGGDECVDPEKTDF